jgi:hypothetical protein
MAKSFVDLKQDSHNTVEKLSAQLAKITGPTASNDDDRFWVPSVDKSGNGFAIIRFLDSPKGEDVPFVRLWEHRFKGPMGSWYVEKCLTTLGKQDPVAEHNNVLWNSGAESDKALARDRKRKLVFISNICIIKDPQKPENEGKVFLFRYGKKIYDKLNDQMNPPGGEDRINPFDFWNGANFKMKMRTVEGYRNYDMSSFDSPTALAETDEEIEAIWKREYPLQPFLDEKTFKSYEELSARLDRVLGSSKFFISPKVSEAGADPDDEEEDDNDAGIDNRVKYFDQMKMERG